MIRHAGNSRMYNDTHVATCGDYFLSPGYIYTPVQSTVISLVLGSAVAVCLYDRKRRVAGINHFQYPYSETPRHGTARHGDAATLTLINMMLSAGAKRRHLRAQVFGGAYRPDLCSRDVGRENILVAKNLLRQKGIKTASEDVGGELGRKVVYKTAGNEVAVLKVERLRSDDWYPYEGCRS